MEGVGKAVEGVETAVPGASMTSPWWWYSTNTSFPYGPVNVYSFIYLFITFAYIVSVYFQSSTEGSVTLAIGLG